MSRVLSLLRTVFVVLLFGGLAASSLAQSSRFEVRGIVTDTTDAPLAGATVVVLQTSDSALVSFGTTAPDGAFRIGRVPSDAYLLQVTFVGFATKTQPIVVDNAPVDVGHIRLEEALTELGELLVTEERIPMVIKKDTLEYDAAAFSVRPNANVEELLKRLPGIEVEQDGSIKAQGENVGKVLVDGKEFFDGDPTVATRNLPADAVDKVQVYDKLSDMAEFTGVDDGNEQKTINVALKEDRKHGYFGNTAGGFGNSVRYEGNASVNRFSPSTQLSLIANLNNVNQQGFSVNDYVNFMGGMQALMQGGGRTPLADAPISNGASAGFSTTTSGGLNVNYDFSARTSVRASYLGYHLDNEQDRSILQQQLAGVTGSAYSRQQVDQGSRNLSHRFNLNVKHELSDGHDVQLRANLQASDADLVNRSDREALSTGDVLENTSRTDYSSSTANLAGDAVLTYRKRLAPGRSLTAEVQSRMNEGDVTGDLEAANRFYGGGNLLTSEEISQLQSQVSHTMSHAQRLTYTEPLGRRQLLQFDAEHRGVLENQDRRVFDRPAGLQLQQNDLLSSAFDRTYWYYTGGITFRRAVEPLTMQVGVQVQQARLEGDVRGIAAGIDRRFIHALPAASLSYEFSGNRNVEMRYDAFTREPSMRELQPYVDNSDPLNVYAGNPSLRPEYTHSAVMRYVSFDQFTFTNFMAALRAGYTFDKISRARMIDDQLRQSVTTVNTDGDWTIMGYASLGTPLRPIGSKINISSQTMLNRGIEFINGAENGARILRSNWNVRLENRNKDVVDASVGARYTFNDARYSLNPAMNQQYVNRTYYGEINYQISDTWRVSTSFDYNLYSKEVFGSGRSVPLWHAELSRMVMNDRTEIKLIVRDVLNKNVGVTYSATNTYLEEEYVDSLGRYVMLKAVYNISGVRRSTAIQIEQGAR